MFDCSPMMTFRYFKGSARQDLAKGGWVNDVYITLGIQILKFSQSKCTPLCEVDGITELWFICNNVTCTVHVMIYFATQKR